MQHDVYFGISVKIERTTYSLTNESCKKDLGYNKKLGNNWIILYLSTNMIWQEMKKNLIRIFFPYQS